jgi:hypothetical protein
LAERFHGMEEVRGSIPLSSTTKPQVTDSSEGPFDRCFRRGPAGGPTRFDACLAFEQSRSASCLVSGLRPVGEWFTSSTFWSAHRTVLAVVFGAGAKVSGR